MILFTRVQMYKAKTNFCFMILTVLTRETKQKVLLSFLINRHIVSVFWRITSRRLLWSEAPKWKVEYGNEQAEVKSCHQGHYIQRGAPYHLEINVELSLLCDILSYFSSKTKIRQFNLQASYKVGYSSSKLELSPFVQSFCPIREGQLPAWSVLDYSVVFLHIKPNQFYV